MSHRQDMKQAIVDVLTDAWCPAEIISRNDLDPILLGRATDEEILIVKQAKEYVKEQND